ncbi:MAG TPA: TIGR03435 family protein [Bryobacteraceae bacterium]|jgi:uncharacterized protein (TIGR03435 family)|nr:TIGR03435 family protein [Bryobacteraceae bacterium]
MHHISGRLNPGAKLMLIVVAGIDAVAGPLAFGALNAVLRHMGTENVQLPAGPAFEVASIKLETSDSHEIMLNVDQNGTFRAAGIPLEMIIEEAYGVRAYQIADAPSWLSSEHYSVEAKLDDSGADEMRKFSSAQRKDRVMLMVRGLLEERCKLTLRHGMKELPFYVLVVTKNGPKFHDGNAGPVDLSLASAKGPNGEQLPQGGVWVTGRGKMVVTGASIGGFAEVLSRRLGQTVLDRTGLKGTYYFKLEWTPEPRQGDSFGGSPGLGPTAVPAPFPDSNRPSLFTAIQEQLGLKLESQKGPVEVIAIDHVEKPSEN